MHHISQGKRDLFATNRSANAPSMPVCSRSVTDSPVRRVVLSPAVPRLVEIREGPQFGCAARNGCQFLEKVVIIPALIDADILRVRFSIQVKQPPVYSK
jgi:hypothetical protein